MEVVVIELIEMEEQFRQIALEIFVDLVERLTVFCGDLQSQIPMQEVEVRALIGETVRYN